MVDDKLKVVPSHFQSEILTIQYFCQESLERVLTARVLQCHPADKEQTMEKHHSCDLFVVLFNSKPYQSRFAPSTITQCVKPSRLSDQGSWKS